jgi:hypothetical protein
MKFKSVNHFVQECNICSVLLFPVHCVHSTYVSYVICLWMNGNMAEITKQRFFLYLGSIYGTIIQLLKIKTLNLNISYLFCLVINFLFWQTEA